MANCAGCGNWSANSRGALPRNTLYSLRSERPLMGQLDDNLLFPWFVGLNIDDLIWELTVFTKNRERLLGGDIAEALFQAVLQQAGERDDLGFFLPV